MKRRSFFANLLGSAAAVVLASSVEVFGAVDAVKVLQITRAEMIAAIKVQNLIDWENGAAPQGVEKAPDHPLMQHLTRDAREDEWATTTTYTLKPYAQFIP